MANETPRLFSDSYEARSTGRLDYVLTRTRHARRDASTTFRLVRGTLDRTPRLRSHSYEARSTGRLDYIPTRTRYARRDASTVFQLVRGSLDKAPRLYGNLRIAQPRVGPLDPPYSPTLRQKSEHLIRLPTTSNHHGYNSNRRGSSTDVKSRFFTAHPGMGGENLSLYAPYRALFCH
jgi:hypothetical protein